MNSASQREMAARQEARPAEELVARRLGGRAAVLLEVRQPAGLLVAE